MKIETEFLDFAGVWTATDTDIYDGAPDASPECQLIGSGATEFLAVKDLISLIEELENGRYLQKV